MLDTYVLLSSPDCHLCDHGREVLSTLAADLGLAWREVSTESDEGEQLAAAAPPLRPVLFEPSGDVLAVGRLSERRLRPGLEREVARG